MVMSAAEIEIANSGLYRVLGIQVTSKSRIKKPRILFILSRVLNKLIQKNATLIESKQIEVAATDFHGRNVPEMGIPQYIERIFTYSSCSPSCFVLAYILLDRFFMCQSMYFTSLTAHRLLITAVMIAAKFMDDVVFNNAYYARVGGVSTKELNKLEMTFLFGIDFRLQVNADTFYTYCLMLQSEVSSAPTQEIERPIQFCGVNSICSKKEDTVFPTTTAR